MATAKVPPPRPSTDFDFDFGPGPPARGKGPYFNERKIAYVAPVGIIESLALDSDYALTLNEVANRAKDEQELAWELGVAYLVER